MHSLLDRSQRQATVEVLGASQEEAQGLFDIIRAHLGVLHGKVRAVEELEIAGHPDSWVSMEKLRLLERKGRRETDEETKEREPATVEVSPTLDTTESREAGAAEGPTPPRRDQSQASAYIQDKEIPTALARLDEGKCVLIPVPLDGAELDPKNKQEERLKKLMTATWNAKPVLKYARHADGWRDVGRAIRAAVEAQRAQRD